MYSLEKKCYDIIYSDIHLNVKINWNILLSLSSRLKCVWLNWFGALWKWMVCPFSYINNCSPLGLCIPWYVITTFSGDSLMFFVKHSPDKEPGESNRDRNSRNYKAHGQILRQITFALFRKLVERISGIPEEQGSSKQLAGLLGQTPPSTPVHPGIQGKEER